MNRPNTLNFLALAAALLLALPAGATAQDSAAAETASASLPTPKEVMRRVDESNRTEDAQRELTMILVNSRGSKREREVISYRKKIDDYNDKALLKFLAPGDVAGTGLLTIEHEDRDDDQWLYLPALKRTRRISAADKNDSFMGTEFTYEDMSSLKLDEYNYKLLGQEKLDGIDVAVIEMVPANEERREESGYSKTVHWVDFDRWVILKSHFYNLKDEHYKTLHSSEINRYGGIWMPDKLVMENLKTGDSTVLEFDNTKINVGLDDRMFTERYLLRGR